MEIPGGSGVSNDPLGTEIPKGWGVQTEKPSVGGVWILSGTTHSEIPNSRLTFLKLWICHFQLFPIVRVPTFHIPLQIKIAMHKKNMPVKKAFTTKCY